MLSECCRRVVVLVGAGVVLTTIAASAAANDFVDKARVLSVTPIIETADELVQDCRYRQRARGARQAHASGSNDIVAKLAGGVIGGAAGSLVGKGSGRDVSAAAGALIGAEVADDDDEITEGQVLGAIAGGLLGAGVGKKGRNRTATTAVGALIGSIIGESIQEQGQRRKETSKGVAEYVRVCDEVYRPRRVITGYETRYAYRDRVFTTILPYEPDGELDVSVRILPIEDR